MDHIEIVAWIIYFVYYTHYHVYSGGHTVTSNNRDKIIWKRSRKLESLGKLKSGSRINPKKAHFQNKFPIRFPEWSIWFDLLIIITTSLRKIYCVILAYSLDKNKVNSNVSSLRSNWMYSAMKERQWSRCWIMSLY